MKKINHSTNNDAELVLLKNRKVKESGALTTLEEEPTESVGAETEQEG